MCGAQKSGTTALAAYLRQHPEIHLPEAKELHFFDDETQTWPEPDLSALHRHFQAADADQLWEATPISLYWDPATERIWRYNSAMRLIVILRNPIERAYSHWAMEHRRGNDPLPFALALEKEEARCRAALPLQHPSFLLRRPRLLWRSTQATLAFLRQRAGTGAPARGTAPESPDLSGQDLAASQHCSRASNPPLTRHNGGYEHAMVPTCREHLRHIFWQEIGQLEHLLGWDCSDWLRNWAMKVLLAIPHVFAPKEGSLYSSQTEAKRSLKQRHSLKRLSATSTGTGNSTGFMPLWATTSRW